MIRESHGPFSNCVVPLHSPRRLLAAVLCFSCSIVLAQPGMPTGANYTDDMPSVGKVESVIQGSDPIDDTATRQVFIFRLPRCIIDRVHTNTNVRAPYTPGEAKQFGDYRGASAQITQDFTKS